MNFSNTLEGTDCHCLDGASEDTNSIYCRKIDDASTLRSRHFKTNFEKPKKIFKGDEVDCKSVCGFRSISVNIANTEEELKKTLNFHLETYKIAPKKGAKLIKFRFKENAGMVKPTPNIGNETHFDFYKENDFTPDDKIEQIGEMRLKDHV